MENNNFNVVRYADDILPGAPPPLFLHVKIFLEPYICPNANTCLKISSSIDLKCLLYVCATVKIQFVNAILNHTHPPLGHYASSGVRAPPVRKFWIRPCLLFSTTSSGLQKMINVC